MIFSREEHTKRVNGKRGMIFTLSTDKFDVKDFPKKGVDMKKRANERGNVMMFEHNIKLLWSHQRDMEGCGGYSGDEFSMIMMVLGVLPPGEKINYHCDKECNHKSS